MTSIANTDYHIIFISKCVASFFLPLRLYTNQTLTHKEGQNISLSWLGNSGKDGQYSVELGQERQGSREPGREEQSRGPKTSARRSRKQGRGVFPAVPIPRERGSCMKTNWSQVELTEPSVLFFSTWRYIKHETECWWGSCLLWPSEGTVSPRWSTASKLVRKWLIHEGKISQQSFVTPCGTLTNS